MCWFLLTMTDVSKIDSPSPETLKLPVVVFILVADSSVNPFDVNKLSIVNFDTNCSSTLRSRILPSLHG